MIVVLSTLICLGGLCDKRLGMARFALAPPLLFLIYALALTQSRGGFLALVAGLGAFFLNRFGSWRAAFAMVVLLPVLMVVFGGRQIDLGGSIGSGTGSQRTELWYVGLQWIKWAPVFGMGHAKFVEHEGLVAHSSYVQALAEWGLIGGTMFIGLFYIVLHSVWRLRQVRSEIRSPLLRNMQPYMLGALAAYATSMLTLTRCDCVPTYLVAGMGVSFERLARRGTTLAPLEARPALLMHMALATVGFIVLIYLYIRFIYRLF
jgi:O-antigen ligase